jgi:hypothetical protein
MKSLEVVVSLLLFLFPWLFFSQKSKFRQQDLNVEGHELKHENIARHDSRKHEINKFGAVMMLVSTPWDSIRNGRHCSFNQSMDSLLNYWYPRNNYPIVLFSENHQWTLEDKRRIRRTWNQFDFSFEYVASTFHRMPTLPEEKFEDAKKRLSNHDYKKMITFMLSGFTELSIVNRYHYILRLDDDACFKDNINYDLFLEMKVNNAYYAFREMYIDATEVVIGLKQFAEDYMSQHKLVWANEDLRNKRNG